MNSSNIISITEKAKNKLLDFQKESPDKFILFFVSSKGCAGFSYNFTFVDNIEKNDKTFNQNGVKLIIGDESMPYIKGTTIDWEENFLGAGFIFNNPNAIASCGCGNSFRID